MLSIFGNFPFSLLICSLDFEVTELTQDPSPPTKSAFPPSLFFFSLLILWSLSPIRFYPSRAEENKSLLPPLPKPKAVRSTDRQPTKTNLLHRRCTELIAILSFITSASIPTSSSSKPQPPAARSFLYFPVSINHRWNAHSPLFVHPAHFIYLPMTNGAQCALLLFIADYCY